MAQRFGLSVAEGCEISAMVRGGDVCEWILRNLGRES